MKARARYRNEVKTRFEDRLYDAMQEYKRHHGIETDSKALERITSLFLLGVIGILHSEASAVSANSAQRGPGTVSP